MLALKIICTVFLGISVIGSFFKNIVAFEGDREVFGFSIYGWLWRALVIVTLWLL